MEGGGWVLFLAMVPMVGARKPRWVVLVLGESSGVRLGEANGASWQKVLRCARKQACRRSLFARPFYAVPRLSWHDATRCWPASFPYFNNFVPDIFNTADQLYLKYKHQS